MKIAFKRETFILCRDRESCTKVNSQLSGRANIVSGDAGLKAEQTIEGASLLAPKIVKLRDPNEPIEADSETYLIEKYCSFGMFMSDSKDPRIAFGVFLCSGPLSFSSSKKLFWCNFEANCDRLKSIFPLHFVKYVQTIVNTEKKSNSNAND